MIRMKECQDLLSLFSPLLRSAVPNKEVGADNGRGLIQCQDLLSLFSPLLRSAVPNKEVGADNGRGLIQKFIKLGTSIGQHLLQAPVMNNRRKLRPSQAFVSKPSVLHSLVLIPRITTGTGWPKPIIMTATTPLPISNHEDYDLMAKNFHDTDRSHVLRIQKNQSFFGRRQHNISTQKTFQFYRNSRQQQQPAKSQQLSAVRFQAPQSVFSNAVRETINFGQEITGLLDEIARYSDVHHQKNQDYESVRKLLNTFFDSVSSDQNNNDHSRWLKPMNDGTETGRNRLLIKNLFESDIVLTVDQLKRIITDGREQQISNPHRRNKRKVITGAIYRWPKNRNISYEFAFSDALYFWQRETCIRWQEDGPGYDRVVFFRGSGCYSNVGKTGGRQEISIGYGCEEASIILTFFVFKKFGIVAHEIGHSLGFWHEQSRPDRDQYIKLQNKYIARGTEGNFMKRSYLEIENMGVPFDLGSVMHYGPNAFSVDWNHTTIQTVDKRYSHTIGQRHGPSFIDVKQMNRLYCNQKCAASSLVCQNGGYPDPNNCQSCKCPTGLGGRTCSDVQSSVCGAELIATDVWQQLAYKGSQKCYWRIRANNAKIRIEIESVNFRCDITCRAFVEIKHNSAFEQTGFRICCGNKKVNVLSEQAEALIIFDAAELGQYGSFSLNYVQDSGKPLVKPSPPIWIPGSENRLFHGLETNKNGLIEKFILNAIPKIRDSQQPAASIASIVTEFTLGKILG